MACSNLSECWDSIIWRSPGWAGVSWQPSVGEQSSTYDHLVEIMHGGSCACMCQEVWIAVRHDYHHIWASVQQREAGLLLTTSCGASESLHIREMF
jgi:hypothetical protein